MAKDFKIVEPEFVTRAKQSAVAAVEARFKHEEEQRRKVERRERAKGCLAWAIILGFAAAGGLYWVCWHYGIDIGSVRMRVEEVLQNRKYERLEETFRIAPIEDWSVVPDDLRPGKVPTNTVYHAMVSGPDGRVMLELQASPGGGMRVWRMSPTIDPVELQPESFQRFISGSPYLIIVNGSLYFCSSKRSQKDREGFRRFLFQPPSAAGRKKKR